MLSPSQFTVTIFCLLPIFILFCFFFNDTATTEIYTLSLHDALPISAILFQLGFDPLPMRREDTLDKRLITFCNTATGHLVLEINTTADVGKQKRLEFGHIEGK